MSSLQYGHLDRSKLQIRLLTLLPAEASKRIRCRLQISSLLDYPLFQALSYQWGPSNEKRQIRVNKVTFEVTDNLYAALRQLRGRFERKVLWIDQICINQTDKEEQKHQVGLMRRIYSQCSVALLWLGKNITLRQHNPLSVLKVQWVIIHHSVKAYRFTRSNNWSRPFILTVAWNGERGITLSQT
jgi:hypothetical protein